MASYNSKVGKQDEMARVSPVAGQRALTASATAALFDRALQIVEVPAAVEKPGAMGSSGGLCYPYGADRYLEPNFHAFEG